MVITRGTAADIESAYAWCRLAASLAMMTLGCAGMYIVMVVLPTVQAEFGVARADASLPYTLTMAGFGVGGVLMGRLTDRCGVMVTVLVGAVGLGVGFIAAGLAPSLLMFSLASGLFLGLLGASASFAPLVADTSLWFSRRRGIALAICTSRRCDGAGNQCGCIGVRGEKSDVLVQGRRGTAGYRGCLQSDRRDTIVDYCHPGSAQACR